jgi:hypothetical protein
LLLYSSHLPLGVPNGLVINQASSSFSGAVAREVVEDFCEGSFRMHILYFVLSFALLYLFYLHCFIKNPKKFRILGSCYFFTLVIMLFPKYVLEDLLVGSGLIIGKDNIDEFFNHISMHKQVEENSLVELAPSIEVASAYLIHMLEARFASLNPFMQHMFLKLHEIEDPEKKAFILKTLRLEFKDVAIEARKVLKRFNKLGSPIKVISTNNEGTKIPIPRKLLGLYEVFENNFDWICPKNLFSDLSEPKRDHKGSSKTYVYEIQCLIEKTSSMDLNASSENT